MVSELATRGHDSVYSWFGCLSVYAACKYYIIREAVYILYLRYYFMKLNLTTKDLAPEVI